MSGYYRSSGPMALPRGLQESSIINALAKSGTPKHPKDCKVFWRNGPTEVRRTLNGAPLPIRPLSVWAITSFDHFLMPKTQKRPSSRMGLLNLSTASKTAARLRAICKPLFLSADRFLTAENLKQKHIPTVASNRKQANLPRTLVIFL